MAKDFSNVNTERVYSAIAEATQEEQTQQEAQKTQEELRAQKEHNKQIAEELKEIQEAQEKRKSRKTYTEEEALAFAQEFRTSGRKDVKLPRINVAFSPENFAYIKIMAKVRGQTQSDFINDVLRNSMAQNEDIYRQALRFRDSI